jgi:Ca2+:H+ antiporter
VTAVSLNVRYLLAFIPLAIVAWAIPLEPALVFMLSMIGIVPLATILAESTEVLSYLTGPKIGSLLNATFGNAVDLILLFALLRSGQMEIVKASIVGSILTTLLLVVGLSQLMGGLKNGIQHFDKERGGMAAAMMMLAVAGLALPTILGIAHQAEKGTQFSTSFQDQGLEMLSLGIAGILLVLYVLQIIFQFRQPQDPKKEEELEVIEAEDPSEALPLSLRTSIALLLASTIGIIIMSEIISGTVEPFGESLGLNPLFIGVVIMPLAGAISEIIVGVRTAEHNKLDLSLSIASNSVMQAALFVAPLLAFLSLLSGQVMTLYFNLFEIIGLGITVFAAIVISSDDVSNWLEGAQLLALYLILGIWFLFLVPPPI